MADIRRSVLSLFQQGVDAVSNAVHHVSDSTRSKLDVMSLQDQRRKLFEALANGVYAEWQQGLELPKELTDMLIRLQEVDEQLKAYAKQEEQAQPEGDNPDEAQPYEPIQVTDEAVQEEATAASPVPTINVTEAEDASDAQAVNNGPDLFASSQNDSTDKM